jgi:hypothetical protein
MKNICIVYEPQTDPVHQVYPYNQPDAAVKIMHSSRCLSDHHNIGMGWYSLRNPKPEDSILVIEPYCVLDIDYDIDFLKKFKYIFTWATKAFENTEIESKIIPINHPSCRQFQQMSEIHPEEWPNWDERADEIVIIANNKTSKDSSHIYDLRIKLADHFHNLYKLGRSKFKVSWYGQIPLSDKEYFKGPIEGLKQDVLKKVKFSICTENSYDPKYTFNYFTEKMPDVWMSGAVPLYMGCYNIDEFDFPTNSYIDLRTYIKINRKKTNKYEKSDVQSLYDRLAGFTSEHYNSYKHEIVKNMNSTHGIFYHISFQRMYEKMIDTFKGV